MLPIFSGAKPSAEPFLHMRVPGILEPAAAGRVLDWLKTRAPWVLRVESFYEHRFPAALDRPPRHRFQLTGNTSAVEHGCGDAVPNICNLAICQGQLLARPRPSSCRKRCG